MGGSTQHVDLSLIMRPRLSRRAIDRPLWWRAPSGRSAAVGHVASGSDLRGDHRGVRKLAARSYAVVGFTAAISLPAVDSVPAHCSSMRPLGRRVAAPAVQRTELPPLDGMQDDENYRGVACAVRFHCYLHLGAGRTRRRGRQRWPIAPSGAIAHQHRQALAERAAHQVDQGLACA